MVPWLAVHVRLCGEVIANVLYSAFLRPDSRLGAALLVLEDDANGKAKKVDKGDVSEDAPII